MSPVHRPILAELIRRFPVVELVSSEKACALSEMIRPLVASAVVSPGDGHELLRGLLRREELGSTGIGGGFAFPHFKQNLIADPVTLLGRSKSGIEWGSLDAALVHVVCLMVTPIDRPGDHLLVLEHWSRCTRLISLETWLSGDSDHLAGRVHDALARW